MLIQAMNTALQGMARNQQAFEQHADRISRWGTTRSDGSQPDIDLDTEMVGVLTSRRGYEANLAVARTADEMVGTLIDTFA